MPPVATKHATPEDVYDWVNREAKRRRLKLTLHSELTKQEDNYMYVPAYLDVDDLYKRCKNCKLLRIPGTIRILTQSSYWS